MRSLIPTSEYLRESAAWQREMARRRKLRVAAVLLGLVSFVVLVVWFPCGADVPC